MNRPTTEAEVQAYNQHKDDYNKQSIRIAELEAGVRRGLSSIEGDPDYRAVEQHFIELLGGEGKK